MSVQGIRYNIWFKVNNKISFVSRPTVYCRLYFCLLWNLIKMQKYSNLYWGQFHYNFTNFSRTLTSHSLGSRVGYDMCHDFEVWRMFRLFFMCYMYVMSSCQHTVMHRTSVVTHKTYKYHMVTHNLYYVFNASDSPLLHCWSVNHHGQYVKYSITTFFVGAMVILCCLQYYLQSQPYRGLSTRLQ